MTFFPVSAGTSAASRGKWSRKRGFKAIARHLLELVDQAADRNSNNKNALQQNWAGIPAWQRRSTIDVSPKNAWRWSAPPKTNERVLP